MTDHNETEASEEGAAPIRFLKDKPKKGKSPLLFAMLVLLAGITYALFARGTMLAPQIAVTPESGDIHAPAALVDRLWVDNVPEKDMDAFNFYIFSSEDNLAINDQAQSTYRHLIEIFFYRASNKELQYQFPHDRRKGKTTYVVEKLPKPDRNKIDLKLTVTADPQSNNQPHVYYSSTSWNSLDASTLPLALRHLPQVPHGVVEPR